MSFFKKSSNASETTVLLPTHKLESNTILLPGVIYRLQFGRFKAATLLARFNIKRSTIIKNLLREFELDKESVATVSPDAYQGIKQFHNLVGEPSSSRNEQELDWLVLACIPSETIFNEPTNAVSVVRIIGVSDDTASIKVTFQVLTRGEIQSQPKGKKSQEAVVKLNLESVVNDIQSQFARMKSNALSLFKEIDGFTKNYHDALLNKNSTNETLYTLLAMNPLANSLYLQLASSDFQKAFASLKRFYDTFQKKLDSKGLLRLIDLTAAILPFRVSQRLEILRIQTATDRVETLIAMLDGLSNIFLNLTESCNNATEYYRNSSDIQKASYISNQLKAVRLLLDGMGNKNSASTALVRSAAPNRALGLPRVNTRSAQAESDDDDLNGIKTFMDNLPNIRSINEDNKRLLLKDFRRLNNSQQQSSDYQVVRNYLEIVIDIPWDKYVTAYANDYDIDINAAETQLNKDHYGLQNVKKRLIQYLAVLKLIASQSKPDNQSEPISGSSSDVHEDIIIGGGVDAQNEEKLTKQPSLPIIKVDRPSNITKAPIILLGGPPGVGKTSLARSIAASLGRNFQRISLGGIRDEAEIRGHRRTYVGAMPGVIIQSLRKARSMNPVILLDEIDKVIGGADGASKVHGDPAAALLEVLDPEQNTTFTDHYLGFPIDLSQVLFICTANDIYNLSRPLLDRLEVIEVSAYDYNEKSIIGKNYLLPRQIKRNGLRDSDIVIGDDVLQKVILDYTREAGVRNLERKLGTICRNKAVEYSYSVTDNSSYEREIKVEDLPKYLGIPHSPSRELHSPFNSDKFGVVNGLSYNSDGSGSVLVFESIGFESTTNSLSMTGRLGDVLSESAKIGLKFVKSIVFRGLLNVTNNEDLIKKFKNLEIHLHVPSGAVSKDGPSAGITMALSFLSLILEKPVGDKIAMTGEITLRGSVLPIGGVREKLLGAHLSGIKKCILPRENRKDIIQEYCKSINDDTKLNALLIDNNSSNFRLHEPEIWLKSKLGIQLVYAEEFWDVIKAVWGDELLNKFEHDRLESHL